MKRILLCVSAIVLFGSMALAQNQSGPRPSVAAIEDGSMGMMALSAGVIGCALVVKRRKKD